MNNDINDTAGKADRTETILPLLCRILRPAETILAICLAVSVILIFTIAILKSVFGVFINANILNTGSMRPTIDRGSLTIELSPDRAPFADLKDGDIITFRDRADNTPMASHSISIPMTIVYLDENGNEYDNADGKGTVAIKQGKTVDLGHTSYPTPDDLNADYRDEGIEYKSVNYTIMHRIVAVREADENSDQALFTQGDNNENRDPKTVLASGYVGKIIWYCDYIGWPLYLLYHGGYTVLCVAVILIGIMLFVMYRINPAVKIDIQKWLHLYEEPELNREQ